MNGTFGEVIGGDRKHPQWTRALWNFMLCPSQKAHIHSRTVCSVVLRCDYYEIECKKTIIWYWIHIKSFSLAPSYPVHRKLLSIASLITWFIQFSMYALPSSGPLPVPMEPPKALPASSPALGGRWSLVPIQQSSPSLLRRPKELERRWPPSPTYGEIQVHLSQAG